MCCARLYCTAAHFSKINSSPLGFSFFQLYFFCTDFFGSAGSAGVNAHFLFAGGSCVLGVVTSLVLVLGTSVIIVISGPTRESNDPEGIKENEPLTRTSSTMVATFASTLLHSFSSMAGSLFSRSPRIFDFADSMSPEICLAIKAAKSESSFRYYVFSTSLIVLSTKLPTASSVMPMYFNNYIIQYCEVKSMIDKQISVE